MLLGTLVSIIFVAAIVVFVIQYYKRVFEHQQELRAKELEKERDLLLALMQGREHEQQRIAEELHDGLAVEVTVVKQQLYLLRKQAALGQKEEARLDEINNMLKSLGENIRAMSHNLMPANIEKFGLLATLSDMIAHINRSSDLKATIVTEGIEDVMLSHHEQLMIYRIVQELIQNIHKHAQATQFTIALTAKGNDVKIWVSDNGRGISVNHSDANFGIGLRNIQSRVKLLDGTFDIKPNKPAGTIASFSFKHKAI
jgi:signal transduction histidine kinase